jgi:hypothetical protein
MLSSIIAPVRNLIRRPTLIGPTLFLTALAYGQEMIPLTGFDGSTLNQELLAKRQEATPKNSNRGVAVLTGDVVIAQFVDGGAWQTAITVVNLENHPTSFDVLFFRDDGMDLIVPVGGLGPSRGVHLNLNVAGSLTFQTTGTNANLAAGWALLSKTTNDSIGIMAIFRQNIPGQAQEAVVPAVNQFENHFVLLFDNTAPFLTGIALANPTTRSVVIPVNIRNELGQIIDTRQFSLGPYSHAAFVLPEAWRSTAGIRGAIEFLTTGFGVGALGLRFNGFAFTSINVLANINWLTP